jgi:hypothetical protein
MKRIIVPLPQRLTADDSLYGVRVRADLTPDGSWEPCIEFESRRGIRLETCPPMTIPTVAEFQEWVKQLDVPYLLQALTKASKGPIRRTRRRT